MHAFTNAVVVVGHLTLDDIVLDSGETAMETPGGDALYASLGVRMWGVRPHLIAAIPDQYPHQIIKEIVEEGVNTQFVQSTIGPGVRQWALYDGKGGRQYHSRLGSSSYEEITPRVNGVSKLPTDVSAAHVAPMPALLQYEWVQWLHNQGCPWILLDPHEDQLQDSDLWNRILALVTVFLPSEVEVTALLGPNVTPLEAAQELAKMGPRIVAIKRGPVGSIVYDRETHTVCTIPTVMVEAVDPTGCGDAYCGGFLAGILQTGDPQIAARWGAVSASFVLEGYGPTKALHVTLDDAVRRLEKYQSIRGWEGIV